MSSQRGGKYVCARFLAVEKKRCLLGMDLQGKVGIVIKQIPYDEAHPSIPVNSVEEGTDDWISNNWRTYFLDKYKEVFTRQGRSKNHVVHTNFHSPLIPIQEKGRRIPIHILERVENEISKLIKDKQIMKLDNCTSDCFIAPIVITAKKDNTIKLALDAKRINVQIHKNK